MRALLAALLLTLSGCATLSPTCQELGFGQKVKHKNYYRKCEGVTLTPYYVNQVYVRFVCPETIFVQSVPVHCSELVPIK